MHRIEVVLSPALYPFRTIKERHTAVAVDILRATTAICAAFTVGAEEVVPLASLDSLDAYAQKGYLRAAERGGRKIDGAECGNSPTEYSYMNLRGAKLAFSTTNGTVSILAAADAERTLVGCFSNLAALQRLLVSKPQDLVILCSGWQSNFCVEDTLFAGELCEQLIKSGCYKTDNDAAFMAMDLWHQGRRDPYRYCLERASHIQRLIGFGARRDIEYAFRHDTCPWVPTLKHGVLVAEQ